MSFHNFVPNDRAIRGVRSLLGLNLNFCPTPQPLDPRALQQALPGFVRSLRLQYQFRNSTASIPVPSKLYVPNTTYLPRHASHELEEFLRAFKRCIERYEWTSTKKRNLLRPQLQILKRLRSENDLAIVHSDKNLGPALLERAHYINLCLDHLTDQQTYRLICSPRVAIIQHLHGAVRAFRRYLDLKFRCKRSCPELKIIDAYLSEKSLSYFYGLVKLHKPELCIRPIVSTCSSPLEGISKWLDFRLQHYYRSLPSYLRDSTQFVDEIRDRMPLPCETMVTLDIVSLYTSIPTEVAIDIVLADLAQHNDPWLPAIKLGLQLVMQHNYFEFGDTLWLQRQGTAMGTSVAPAFASLYVAHFEAIVRREFSAHMAYYRRFIDDIFILWFDADLDPALPSLMAFKDRLSELSRLNFTITTSPSEINFLDLTVLRTHHVKLRMTLPSSIHVPFRSRSTCISTFRQKAHILLECLKAPSLASFKHIGIRTALPKTVQPLLRPSSSALSFVVIKLDISDLSSALLFAKQRTTAPAFATLWHVTGPGMSSSNSPLTPTAPPNAHYGPPSGFPNLMRLWNATDLVGSSCVTPDHPTCHNLSAPNAFVIILP